MKCSFCGGSATAPIDVAGRGACSARCAEKLAVRDAATADDAVIEMSEIDGIWLVDQVNGTAERKRDEQ
jgi:hypothetical protein